jgi:phosphatidylserine/phosphatidylglycerophosphate/cardiolipin synthase-like enzyme
VNAAHEALLDHVSAMGRELSPSTIASLCSDIVAGKSTPAGNARVRFLRERLGELWTAASDVGASELAFALLAAQRAAGDLSKEQSTSIVWTGPDTNVPVRRNDQALYEVIASAEAELLIVSFVVYRVPKIASGIVEAVARGVSVTLVLERHDVEGQQKEGPIDPMKALGSLPSSVRVLEWDMTRRPKVNGKVPYIHVKSAVSDKKLAFVSSANLTVYGLESNIEMGLLVQGGAVPAWIANQFSELESMGELVPVVRP